MGIRTIQHTIATYPKNAREHEIYRQQLQAAQEREAQQINKYGDGVVIDTEPKAKKISQRDK